MRGYTYRALNTQGEIIAGSVQAQDKHHLRGSLGEQGLSLISARRSFLNPLWTKGSAWTDLQELTHTLGTLIQAHVPILEALETTGRGPFSPALGQVITQVRGGASLSAAFAWVGGPFDGLFCGLVAAGEQGGRLNEAFFSLSDYYQSRAEMAAKLEKAYRYPLFLFVLWGITFYVLMTVLVPPMGDFLATLGRDVTPVTRSLLAFSRGVSTYGLGVMGGLGLLGLWFLTPLGRAQARGWAARLPLVRQARSVRFLGTLAALLRGGVSLMPALCLVEKNTSLGNRPLSPLVAGGLSLSQAAERQHLLDDLSIRMIAVGERTGKLVDALDFARKHHKRALEKSLDGLIQTLEPTMLLILGGLLLWIVLGTIYPLYDSFSHIAF